MDAVLESLARRPFDLLFVALPDVDRSSHTFGPASHQARKALLEADRQVLRLVKALERNGVWGETVLMVTADHGFVSVAPDAAAGRPYPAITVGRVLARAGIDGVGLLGAGGLETIALRGTRNEELSVEDQARLADVRRAALAEPGVIEAWYRVANPADGGDQTTLRHAHPDWRLDHPRIGDLVLVAAPGHHFIDPFSNWAAAMSGTHGGPDVQRIPIVITGGHPRLARSGRIEADGGARSAANPDLGATATWLLDLPQPRTISGKAVPPASRGRVLREAFAK
jgi:arylsulfatase A-like enzyme